MKVTTLDTFFDFQNYVRNCSYEQTLELENSLETLLRSWNSLPIQFKNMLEDKSITVFATTANSMSNDLSMHKIILDHLERDEY